MTAALESAAPVPPVLPAAVGRPASRLLFWTCLACVGLYAHHLIRPVLFQDDIPILASSANWSLTRANLWVPNNDHVMPLGRLLTYGLVRLAGSCENLPRVAVGFGPVVLVAGVLLLYVFLRRELGHPFYALAGAILFGVSSVYCQAVYWFAASFSVLAMDTLLLGLLAAQRWRQTGRSLWLDAAFVAALLAPGWFGIGILAGPLITLYLLVPEQEASQGWFRRASLAPFFGTVLFLAVALPRSAEGVLHADHYGDQTAWQAFGLLEGALRTGRSILENLIPGLVGAIWVRLPVPLVLALLPLLLGAAVWWWWRAPCRRLVVLGAGLIVVPYLLTYSARATWDYDLCKMNGPSWARYHLLPQLGLTLLVLGGLPAWEGRWFSLRPDGRLSPGQVRFFAIALVLLFLANLPRGAFSYAWDVSRTQQLAALRIIDEVDALCVQHHISADQARAVLPRLAIEGNEGRERVDPWLFLHGSPSPEPHSPEEVRRLLAAALERIPEIR
jgi:hypothetical protein